MHYHILLTETCNSECSYCYEKSMKEFENGLDKVFKFDFSSPEKSIVKAEDLKKFLAKDNQAVLIFYGGEPLMEIEKIKEIMDNIDVPFRMQTNGKLLDKLPSQYVNRIDKMLISLDGTKERTDSNRGNGTYDKVMQNIQLIKDNGYKGELIARMTIRYPDIYEQVLALVKAGFTSVHWQLDAGFYKFDFDKEKFSEFVDEYNNSISKLVNYWMLYIKQNKRVLKFYPFIAIIHSLLHHEKTFLRCGAGHLGYAITTNGKVIACPIMNCITDFECGNLSTDPKKLKKFDVKGRCLKCSEKDLCGGRCLYWNYAHLWPEKGDDMICSTVKHYIGELKKRLPEIKRLIGQNFIRKEYFSYEKYFGPEIIP